MLDNLYQTTDHINISPMYIRRQAYASDLGATSQLIQSSLPVLDLVSSTNDTAEGSENPIVQWLRLGCLVLVMVVMWLLALLQIKPRQ